MSDDTKQCLICCMTIALCLATLMHCAEHANGVNAQRDQGRERSYTECIKRHRPIECKP